MACGNNSGSIVAYDMFVLSNIELNGERKQKKLPSPAGVYLRKTNV